MNVNHEEYLQRILDSKKLELDKLNIQHRLDIVVYETRNEALDRDIRSIEAQLEGGIDR